MSNEQKFFKSIDSRPPDTDRPVERIEETEQCVELVQMERVDQAQPVSSEQPRSASIDRDEKNQQPENPNNLIPQSNHTVYLPAAAIIVDRHDKSNLRDYNKVLMLGEDIEGGHKTRFCWLLIGNLWDDYVPTVFDTYSNLTLGEKKFSICDTTGQADHDRLISLNYPKNDIIFVFGRTTQEVQKWANHFTQHEKQPLSMSFFNETNPISETTYRYYNIDYGEDQEAIGKFDLIEVQKIKDIESISQLRRVNRELTITMVQDMLSHCSDELSQPFQKNACTLM